MQKKKASPKPTPARSEGAIITGGTVPMVHEGGKVDAILPREKLVQALNGQDKPTITVRVMTDVVDEKRIVGLIRKGIERPAILDTPPPYKQSWLDENGLEVIYTKGRAVLRFKK